MEAASLEERYARAIHEESDINEHLPTLRQYASECSSVAEFGVRTGLSSWALLKGLVTARDLHGAKDVRLLSVDLKYNPSIFDIWECAFANHVPYRFVEQSDLDTRLEHLGGVDMLFIDTWHVYAQLKRELETHAPHVRKYIVLHDTEVDREHGETIRNGWNSARQSECTGFPVDETERGMGAAIEEFLDGVGADWIVDVVFTNNNGLTVLRRRH